VFATRRGEDAGYAVVDEMRALGEPPTAILLVYEANAIGVYRRLGELGLVPGRDLAVIGFRDEPTVRFLSPSLTCFSVSLHDLGVSVGEALLAQLPPYARSYPFGVVQKRYPLELLPGASDGPVKPSNQIQRPQVGTAKSGHSV
jgi:DNA-binding LacI/PurR family transcriptional regulator